MSRSTRDASRLLGGLLISILALTLACQAQRWETHAEAGLKAYEQGRYAEAEESWRTALRQAERLGPAHPRVLQSLNYLAGLYQAQGKYPEAASLLERVLAIVEDLQGPNDPALAQALSNLGAVYYSQENYARAQHAFERALAIREKARTFLWRTPGYEWERAVPESLDNLAKVYHARQQYVEAERLQRRALAIREEAFGPDHVDVARSLYNLAFIYASQQKFAEAEPLYQRSLEVLEKALGQEHPHLASVLDSYALLLRSTDRDAEAAELEARAKAIRAAPAAGTPVKPGEAPPPIEKR